MEIPDGVIDLVWELKDEDTGDTAFLTFQIITEENIHPDDILQYKNTRFHWNGKQVTVMGGHNEHMVCAHRETIKKLKKTCRELGIDLEEHNINLMTLEEFTPVFKEQLRSEGVEGEDIQHKAATFP